MFFPGRFDMTKLVWMVFEKQTCAILTALDGMQWIVATSEGFILYTDHNNLIFLFYFLSIVSDMSTILVC